MTHTRKKTDLEKQAEDFIKNYPKGTYKNKVASKKETVLVKSTRIPHRNPQSFAG